MTSAWNPASADVLARPVETTDSLRERCPVAHSPQMGWSLLRHADVLRAVNDPTTYSSCVSAHRAVPNGMDPPQHTAYRRALEGPFGARRMALFEPACRRLAIELVEKWKSRGSADVVDLVAGPYAARAQCAFLGWPDEAHRRLLEWTERSRAATASGGQKAQKALAAVFRDYVLDLLAARRDERRDDATDDLLAARVDGSPLTDDDLVSVLRNWTVGEVGTIAAAVAIVAGFLAGDPTLQAKLRAAPDLLPEAIDEILRLQGPLLSNRRVTTRDVRVAGTDLPAGSRVSLMWTVANRDGRVFDEPGAFRWGRDPRTNLLYGAGIHVCPGAPLARLELRVIAEELLARTAAIRDVAGETPIPAAWPEAGWRRCVLRVE